MICIHKLYVGNSDSPRTNQTAHRFMDYHSNDTIFSWNMHVGQVIDTLTQVTNMVDNEILPETMDIVCDATTSYAATFLPHKLFFTLSSYPKEGRLRASDNRIIFCWNSNFCNELLEQFIALVREPKLFRWEVKVENSP